MTTFLYRKIVDGKEVLLPELKEKIDSYYHHHQQDIHRTLTNFGLHDWRVIIGPGKSGGGIVKNFHWIILIAGSRKEMFTTLYHEIFHFLCPDAVEKEIEEMGTTFYKLMEELEE